ncbi:MAG: SapC family protein [Phenylobacterium sp.]|uniref:SapC family protein n=1 Tax=Phenylobacterium sp. TaxID=1871053 RepID=UPI0027308E66|nr:SapC family protein [Phenylobacterium sp.]MDP2011312.1 SapC family protein [Phenylobacterium sp.]
MRPLFYQNPVALHPTAHGAAGLAEALDYGFARKTNAIPVSLAEIPIAALSYPIAFTTEGGARPVAVVGLRQDENLFVDAKGAWMEGAYVPAYVRRYPFILAEYGEGEERGVQLCIEDQPEILVQGAGQPLFADGEPSRIVKSAFDFCKSLRAADLATAPFVEALVACGILEGRAATIQLPTGGDLKMAGFATIDEAKLRALPDEVFLLLRRQGWMSAIYAQMHSALNWARLGDLLVSNDR